MAGWLLSPEPQAQQPPAPPPPAGPSLSSKQQVPPSSPGPCLLLENTPMPGTNTSDLYVSSALHTALSPPHRADAETETPVGRQACSGPPGGAMKEPGLVSACAASGGLALPLSTGMAPGCKADLLCWGCAQRRPGRGRLQTTPAPLATPSSLSVSLWSPDPTSTVSCWGLVRNAPQIHWARATGTVPGGLCSGPRCALTSSLLEPHPQGWVTRDEGAQGAGSFRAHLALGHCGGQSTHASPDSPREDEPSRFLGRTRRRECPPPVGLWGLR